MCSWLILFDVDCVVDTLDDFHADNSSCNAATWHQQHMTTTLATVAETNYTHFYHCVTQTEVQFNPSTANPAKASHFQSARMSKIGKMVG